MARDQSWDCWHTQLCSLGPSHVSSGREPCRFAHSLGELRAPIEIRHRYDHYWQMRQVDRFYGQQLSREQIERFKRYWSHGRRDDRPSWAVGLRLLLVNEELSRGMAHSWDFGLSLDIDVLRTLRNYDRGAPRLPFSFYEGLWPRLERRRAVMNQDGGVYMSLAGSLGVNPPATVLSTPPQQYPLGPALMPERPVPPVSQAQPVAAAFGPGAAISCSRTRFVGAVFVGEAPSVLHRIRASPGAHLRGVCLIYPAD